MSNPSKQTIHGLVATQAARSRNAVAIAAPGRPPMTFARLDEQLHVIGTSLHGLGIGRNNSVLIALPRGPEATVATLSVAAYSIAVPIDTAESSESAGRCIDALNVAAVMVLADEDSAARDAAYDRGTTVIEVECSAVEPAGVIHPLTAASDFTTYPIPARSDDVAIHLVSGGSWPDQLAMMHGDVQNSAARLATALRLGPGDRCLNLIPLWGLGGSIKEVIATLQSGGCVVCPSSAQHRSDFFDWLDECHPTWFTIDAATRSEILAQARSNAEAIRECGIRFVRSHEPDMSPATRAGLERMFNAKVLGGNVEG